MNPPIDFIREKYIKPNNLTQDILCEALKIGKKTMSELYQHKRRFNIQTAQIFAKFFNIKPEFILIKQIEYDLWIDNVNYDDIKPFKQIELQRVKMANTKWILAIINNSISDVLMHYDIKDLENIFKLSKIQKKYHYAIITIFKEVEYNDIIKYCELNNIKKSHIQNLYNFYKTSYNAKKINQYEWLFQDV